MTLVMPSGTWRRGVEDIIKPAKSYAAKAQKSFVNLVP